LPVARRVFPATLDDAGLDPFVAAVNRVAPSLIRVQADEVTYNLHVIVRFELERSLLSGDLSLGDLPGAWAEKYERYLNTAPAHDGEGCLQDIHWSAGLFGYFPTYTLGNVVAAQLFEAAGRALGDLGAMLARGEFAPLLEWLRSNVHRHGKRFRPGDLVAEATGSRPDPAPFLSGLEAKYAPLYGL
jgi:carboxypeptidase Taq